MVGRKTSPRCGNCAGRKVKCDLLQPSCTQCINRKLQCPGYDTESRFFVYKKQPDQSISPGPSPSSEDISDSSKGTVSRKRADRLVVARAPPLAPIEILRGDFVARLTHRNVAARLMVIPEHQILQHIPRRLGSNRALDDAVKCVCSDGSLKPGQIYTNALNSLQKALSHSEQSISSETLGAATLLQMFEHSVDHAEYRWIVHANGVINMIKLRGPSCIKNELDRAILQAQIGNIWFKALHDGTECFLFFPEWDDVVTEIFDPTNDVNSEWCDMIRCGLSIPGLLRQYEQFAGEEQRPPPISGRIHGAQDLSNCAKLLLELWKTRDELSRLRVRFQSLKEIEFCDPNEVTKLVGQPRTRHASRLAINVFSVLIEYMLENILGTDIGDRAAHEELFDSISMSGYVTTAGRLNALASAAESYLKALRLTDNIAASQTAGLSRIMMQKVLNAPISRNSKLSYLTPVLEKLYRSLGGSSHRDSMDQNWS